MIASYLVSRGLSLSLIIGNNKAFLFRIKRIILFHQQDYSIAEYMDLRKARVWA
jgi:hypothetical protein